jgi:hypothetical protein
VKSKNKIASILILIVTTTVLIAFLRTFELKFGLFLFIVSIPSLVFSIYFGIKDYQCFFLPKGDIPEALEIAIKSFHTSKIQTMKSVIKNLSSDAAEDIVDKDFILELFSMIEESSLDRINLFELDQSQDEPIQIDLTEAEPTHTQNYPEFCTATA